MLGFEEESKLNWSEEMKSQFMSTAALPGAEEQKTSLPKLSEKDGSNDLRQVKSEVLASNMASVTHYPFERAIVGGKKQEVMERAIKNGDLRAKGFTQMACEMSRQDFNEFLKRDDLTCKSEMDVLDLVVAYIRKVQQ